MAAVAQSERSGPVLRAGLAAQELARQLPGQHQPAPTLPERSRLAAAEVAAELLREALAVVGAAVTVWLLEPERPGQQIPEAVVAVQALPHHLAAMAAAV